MKQMAVVAVVLACSLIGVGCASERYAHSYKNQYAKQDTLYMMTKYMMTKDDVIALSRAKVSDDVILSQTDITGSYFRLGTQDIIDLANAGVSDKVIGAMITTDVPSKSSGESDGGSYYPANYWYAGYPFAYPWYPSFYLGFSYGYRRPFHVHRLVVPHHTFVGHSGFHGGHNFNGGGHGFGGPRGGGRRR